MPSATTTPASSQSNSLKGKLKKWEHQFKASEGRLPTKADIKANPEIAQMYHTYNNCRKGPRISHDASHHSTSGQVVEHQVFRTPNRTQKSTRIPISPQSASKQHSEIQIGVNSPSKLRKLVQDHASPRKLHGNHLSTKSHKPSIGIKHTPQQILDQSPFDFDSGGGKGSPNLFADLLLESAKDTPRTKARKFLSGIGSPLKASQLSNSENVSKLDDQNEAGGLSSFLKTTTARTPEKPLTEKNILNRGSGDDDEVLGPSPFKPVSNIFQPLFADPINDYPDHQRPIDSPTKSINSKWKRIVSSTPFMPQSQSRDSKSTTLESAQRAPAQSDKRKNHGLGIKRKRVVLGAGEEEHSNFYTDLPDPSKAQTSSVSSLNKKKRFQLTSSNNHHPQTTKIPNQGNLTNQSSRTSHKQVKPIRLASHLPSDEGSRDQEDVLLTTKILDLPSGNPDHSAVYTELETFKFTRLTGDGVKDDEREKSSQVAGTTSKSEKAKGKMKIKADDTTKPVKLGTQKVLVRAYRPLEPNQLKGSTPSPAHLEIDKPFEEIDDIDDNLSKEEDAEELAEDESDTSEITSEPDQEDDSEAEADLQISEELMNVLNIDKDLTIEGEDRSHLLRELRREKKVKEILEGRRLTVFERAFNTRPSNNNPIVNALKKPNKKLSRGRNPNKMTDQPKLGLNQRSSSLHTTSKTLPSQSDYGNVLSQQYQENNEENSLQFELGLDELQTQEIIESHIYGDDDDWEDEPSGWKKLEHMDNDDVDD